MASGWVSDPGTLLLAVCGLHHCTHYITYTTTTYTTVRCTVLCTVCCVVCLRAVSPNHQSIGSRGSQDVEVLVYGHPQLLPALRVRTAYCTVRATASATCPLLCT